MCDSASTRARLQGGHEKKKKKKQGCFRAKPRSNLSAGGPGHLEVALLLCPTILQSEVVIKRTLQCLILSNEDAITHYVTIYFLPIQAVDTGEMTRNFQI